MRASTVTGVHRRYLLADAPAVLELHDGAQAVPVLDPSDPLAWAAVVRNGVKWVAVTCCGPAAPMPYRPGTGLDRLSRISSGTYWP